MQNTAVWIDTGFLVALFARNDNHHLSATQFLQKSGHLELHCISPVIVEACFFLNSNGKQALLQWIELGALILHDIQQEDLPLIRRTLEKYKNIEPDFTDAALVSLADLYNIDSILTVDKRDFSIYRLSNGKPFKRLWL